MASNETPKVIFIKGCPKQRERDSAAAGLVPGMLVETDANGALIPHGTAAGDAIRSFVLPNEIVGKGIDSPYGEGEVVQYGIASGGDVVYTWLAADQTVDAGSYGASDGEGHMASHPGAGPSKAVGVFLEALDTTGASGPTRIKMEVL